MKFSENLISILKNFSAINGGIVLKEGSIIRTINAEKTILAEAKIEEQLPQDFAIYDLSLFLNNVLILKNPDISFTEKHATLKDDDFELCYKAASPGTIITPPQKNLSLNSVDVSFHLTHSSIQKMLKIAAMNSLESFSVVGENGSIYVKIYNKKDDSKNEGLSKLADYAGKDFKAIFKTEYLKLNPDDYDVEIQLDAFAKFTNKAGNLTYFISFDPK